MVSLNICELGFLYTGEQCSSYQSLDTQGLKDGNCPQLVNGTHGRYRTFECGIKKFKYYNYMYNYYDYYSYYYRKYVKRWKPPQCLSKLCHYLALCLKQTSDWKKLCSEKFYRFRNSRFDISTVTAEVVNASYVRNIHVKHCKTIYGGWNTRTVTVKFAIKTSGYRCESKNIQNGKWKCIYCSDWQIARGYHPK